MASASNMPAFVRLAHTKAESIPLLLAVACENSRTSSLNPSKGIGVGNAAVTNQPCWRVYQLGQQRRLPLPAATKSLSLPRLSTVGFHIVPSWAVPECRSGSKLQKRAMVVTTPVLIPSASSCGRMVSTSPVTCKHPFKRSRARGWAGICLHFFREDKQINLFFIQQGCL